MRLDKVSEAEDLPGKGSCPAGPEGIGALNGISLGSSSDLFKPWDALFLEQEGHDASSHQDGGEHCKAGRQGETLGDVPPYYGRQKLQLMGRVDHADRAALNRPIHQAGGGG